VKRLGIWESMILYSLFSLVLPVYGQAGPLRFPESRSYSPGKVWLGWSPAERTGFVRGFIIGHGDGYQSGCRSAETNSTRSRMAANQFDPCLQQRHLFRKQAGFYEQFITDFYNRYAMDRDVPVRVLLLQADEKTPDEVHDWLAKKPD
jgi:hypothetical protein